MYIIDHSPMEKVYYALLTGNETLNEHLAGSFARYTCLRPFFAQMFPFNFLKSGQTAIQVGSHDQFIDMGLSQTFIMASIVGETGRVYVVEPDPKNIAAIRAYADSNGLGNVSVIEKAIWTDNGKTEFTVFEDYSSTNRLAALDHTTVAKHRERLKTRTNVIEVETVTLETIIDDHIGQMPSFINITINTAEPEAIASLGGHAHDDLFITFPVCNARFHEIGLLDQLIDQGFNIVIGDARPKRMDEPFWVALLSRRDVSGVPFVREAELGLMADGSIAISS